MKPVSSSGVRRILFVRPRFLGDVCLTLPAVDAALAACPGAQAAYVTEAALAPLLKGDARFAEVITVPSKPTAGETLALIGKLRRFAPDVAFDFFCNPRTAVWTAASGARIRVGSSRMPWSAIPSSCPSSRSAPRSGCTAGRAASWWRYRNSTNRLRQARHAPGAARRP